MVRSARNTGKKRFDDMASYITDTSSITNPAGLGFSFSSEEEEDDDEASFMDSAASALTGLTGWTSANGHAAGGASRVDSRVSASVRGDSSRGNAKSRANNAGEVSELGMSENFPTAHSKSYKSYKSSAYSGSGLETAVSDLDSSPAISFDVHEMNGSVETNIDEIEVLTRGSSRSFNSKRAAGPPALFPSTNQQGSISPTNSTLSNVSNRSNASKNRAPVPPLRDPSMEDKEEDQMWEEDCNYDINPTLMFLVLESRDWKEAMALLDGKRIENKNDAWNLGSLFGGKKPSAVALPAQGLAKKQQKELQVQARTWIARREQRSGVLRWRMLPIHAALAFNAPFDVVLRLYHLYPGAVRCRNDQGMLPMHHVFKYGNEDKILELLLDVFPEALTVLDDKKRLPLECTPQDGSDNERRSFILTLFANFQVELAAKKYEEQSKAPKEDGSIKDDIALTIDQNPSGPLATIKEGLSPRMTPLSPVGDGGTLLGASAPKYSTNTDYNNVTFNSIIPLSNKKTATAANQQQVPAPMNKKNLPLSPNAVEDDDSSGDRYAMLDGEDTENNPLKGNGGRSGGMGLSTIPEDGTLSPIKKQNTDALKAELLELGAKKKRKGLKKLFRKKRSTQI